MTIAALVLALIASPSADAAGDPVLLDFHASWCGPCREMRPAIDLLTRKGYPVKSVDIDGDPEMARRYRVSAVPAFVVVDDQGRALARTEGLQPAAQLASLYREARAKVSKADLASEPEPVEQADAPEPADDQAEAEADDEDADRPAPAPAVANPKPWETVVRIYIHMARGKMGVGSGTVIHSTPEETLVLTCAHIFHVDGTRRQPSPPQFPHKITVDLFDGVLHGPNGQTVHKVETLAGQAVDYDFVTDVGLIRIKPGRRLPSARVVPPTWRAKPRMTMTTVGCSHGNDATAWTTKVLRPGQGVSHPNANGQSGYVGIECLHAPKQGRSGGGLFTIDGYLAGVCDFATFNDSGIYAAPESIYRLLDRNRLASLYDPAKSRPETLLARERPKARPAPVTLRAQGPETPRLKPITIPRPELLGVQNPPADARNRPRPQGSPSWQSSRDSEELVAASRTRPSESDRVEADLQMDSAPEDDPFPPVADEPAPPPSRPKPGQAGKWRAVRTPAPVAAE